jgi:NAD(P)-dependent dehydrogenase (short-subunit alcohol dehydrogenase family)
MELPSRACVVAGAPGTTGVTIGRRLYAEGAHLAITYRTVEPQKLCEEVSQGPGRTACYKFDITDGKQVETVIQ